MSLITEYDIPSPPINELVARNVTPFTVYTLDLSVAGTRDFRIPGTGFVPYFYDSSSTNKARYPSGLINVLLNDNPFAGDAFPAKHNRGFVGAFYKLSVSWDSQIAPGGKSGAPVFVDLVIFHSRAIPWMTDDIEPVVAPAPVGPGFDTAGTSSVSAYQVNPVLGLNAIPGSQRVHMYVSGFFPGANVVTANPQFGNGQPEEELIVSGTDDTSWPVFNDGNGLMLNGPWQAKNGDSMYLVWDDASAVWREISRR